MAGPNSEPLYSRVADIQWEVTMTVAHNAADLTTGTSYLAFTADATNGGFVREVRFKVAPAVSTAATVLRIWINNGSTISTAANSVLFGELGIPATTTSATAAQPDFVYPMNLALPPGYRIYVTTATDPGATAINTIVVGGKY